MREIDNEEWERGYTAYYNLMERDEDMSDDWLDGWDCADSDSDDGGEPTP